MRRALLSLVLSAGCVPEDAIAPPAEILVTVELSPAGAEGFLTDDGWFVEVDQLGVNLGPVDLMPVPGCQPYSRTHYTWDLDLVAGRHKVGLVHGLGQCPVRVGIGQWDDAVREGAGFDPDLSGRLEERFIVVRIHARRGDEVRDLELLLPNGFIGGCAESNDDLTIRTYDFAPSEHREVALVVHPERIFLHPAVPNTTGLDWVAASDYGDDGVVSYFELGVYEDAYLIEPGAGLSFTRLSAIFSLADGGPCAQVGGP